MYVPFSFNSFHFQSAFCIFLILYSKLIYLTKKKENRTETVKHKADRDKIKMAKNMEINQINWLLLLFYASKYLYAIYLSMIE